MIDFIILSEYQFRELRPQIGRIDMKKKLKTGTQACPHVRKANFKSCKNAD